VSVATPDEAFLHRLADLAADAVLPHFRAAGRVDSKGKAGFDPVTEADRAAEAAMRRLIGQRFPDHGIVGEELGAEREGADYVWVLDPIDGTRAFISGVPVWGILIGLLHEGRPVLGMMAQPFTKERFVGDGRSTGYAGPDGTRALRARACPNIDEAALFTTSPHLFAPEERPAYQRVEAAARMTRYGCDSYAYCMLAMGLVDLVVEAGLHPYDIVALIPIIEGAGGRVTSWTGGPAAGGGRILASGDATLHEKALGLLRI
jgi:histidinol phosphatase-like enzyme (inositol monophosphatase family)